MAANHAVVWIDHRIPRIIHLAADEYRLVEIEPDNAPRRLHQKRGIIGSGRAPTDYHYLDRVAADLVGVDRVLITGPGAAQREFADRLHTHHLDVSRHVVAVDTVSHTSERQLVAPARPGSSHSTDSTVCRPGSRPWALRPRIALRRCWTTVK